MEIPEVKIEEVALDDSSEKHKQTESLEQLKIKLFLWSKTIPIASQGEWNSDTGHKHKEGHYDIP